MTQTNGNGHAKRLHLYVTAVAALVAMALSILGYVREVRDDKARDQAGEGLNSQQKVIDGLQARVEFNSQLLLELHRSVATADNNNRRGETRPPERTVPGDSPAPPAPRTPPAQPRLIPPDELFKKAPPIPRQEKRDWKDYEQRAR